MKSYRLALFALVLSLGFSSCSDDEEESSCVDGDTFTATLEEFADFLDTDYECSELTAEWGKVEDDYADLCEDEKTSDVESEYAVLEEAIGLLELLCSL